MRRERCYLAMRAFLSRFGPPLALMAAIFYLSAQPGLSSGLSFDVYLRKAAHMTEFALLTVLWWRAFRYRALPAAALLVLAYAATDELHQTFVPGRSGQVTDWLIDGVGVLLGVLVCKRLFSYFRRHEH